MEQVMGFPLRGGPPEGRALGTQLANPGSPLERRLANPLGAGRTAGEPLREVWTHDLANPLGAVGGLAKMNMCNREVRMRF